MPQPRRLRIASYNIKAAGVDRIPRGEEKTSDHAPMWIEVEV